MRWSYHKIRGGVHTLDRLPDHHRADTEIDNHTISHLQSQVNSTCISLDFGKKWEYPEEAHVGT